MKDYYRERAPHHDRYMGYTGAQEMERQLAPVIEWVEPEIVRRDVLEIACGTGNWTQVLSRRARTVLATDVFEEYLVEARRKPCERGNVVFRAADGFTLEGITESLDAAFAADWYSHIPNSRIPVFMCALRRALLPGSRVVLVDMMSTPELEKDFSHVDDDGNRFYRRTLPTGKSFSVVKNFPSGKELADRLGPFAADFRYSEHAGLRRWMLACTLKE
jgi:demethylmenaquinone methyltransferase/2-methoxy-6-polyprenyl-1,4-benzoquinol methylase